jgi:hypothetical protein
MSLGIHRVDGPAVWLWLASFIVVSVVSLLPINATATVPKPEHPEITEPDSEPGAL